MTRDERRANFIEKAKKVHGDKYDYSYVVYKHSQIKVNIICNTHGEFSILPAELVRGKGCRLCGRTSANDKLRLTRDEVVERMNSVHGNEYDYSQVEYVDTRARCLITHNLCGKTSNVIVGNHMSGARCVFCYGSPKTSLEDFYSAANKVHGEGEYDYSQIKFSSLQDKVIIVHRCGHEFKMRANYHIYREQGCPVCFGTPKRTTESFVEKARSIHGDTFDYSAVKYVDARTKVQLTCSICEHIFWQKPSNHLFGQGCLNCFQQSKRSKSEIKWLDGLGVPKENRNIFIRINNQKFNVDALHEGVVYEFYGSYWHGDPRMFLSDKINTYNGKTMSTLYQHTMEREQALRAAGYDVKYIWEFDWIKSKKLLQFSSCHPHEQNL